MREFDIKDIPSKEKIIRVYPKGFTGDSFGELQRLLEDGWLIKGVVLSFEDSLGGKINDYILTRYDTQN